MGIVITAVCSALILRILTMRMVMNVSLHRNNRPVNKQTNNNTHTTKRQKWEGNERKKTRKKQQHCHVCLKLFIRLLQRQQNKSKTTICGITALTNKKTKQKQAPTVACRSAAISCTRKPRIVIYRKDRIKCRSAPVVASETT